MRREHYERFLAHAFELDVTEEDGQKCIAGSLLPKHGGELVPVRGGIPRFVPDEGYAANFALQWNRFRLTQLDSYTGKPLYFTRFWFNTRWKPKELHGKTVLEIGAGAGAFTEILAATGAHVVSVDLCSAIDANRTSHHDEDVLFVQADLYDLPFEPESFDFVFCYGVLQHTPDPDAAYRALWKMVKPGGRISIDHYAKRNYLDPWYQPKYAWRPITTRMSPERLLRLIELYIPFWLPIDVLIRRIPILGPRLLAFIRIPCWNHYELGLGYTETQRWAIMNTFDALGARYDFPKSPDEVKEMVASSDTAATEVFYGSNGVVANVRKAAPAARQ